MKKGVRLLGCGSRNWTDYKAILRWMKTFHKKHVVSVLIEGEGRGADKLIRKAAQELEIPVLPFPANWEKFGRAAGPIRNQEQLHHGKPDIVVAFHDDIQSSRGTADMIRRAERKGLKIIRVGHVHMVDE